MIVFAFAFSEGTYDRRHIFTHTISLSLAEVFGAVIGGSISLQISFKVTKQIEIGAADIFSIGSYTRMRLT